MQALATGNGNRKSMWRWCGLGRVAGALNKSTKAPKSSRTVLKTDLGKLNFFMCDAYGTTLTCSWRTIHRDEHVPTCTSASTTHPHPSLSHFQ